MTTKGVRGKLEDVMVKPSMKLFSMLCGYFLTVFLVFFVLQIFDAINWGVIQILGVLVPVIGYLILEKNTSRLKRIALVGIFGLLVVGLPFVFNGIHDFSSDGNYYHKMAIGYLENGWNPLKETMREFQGDNEDVVPIADGSRVDLWVEHYPKATWVLAANFYNMTGSIESGKCVTVILMLMLCILGYNCLRKILNWKWSVVITALLVTSPIMVAQVFSYYIDGVMGICFAMEIMLLMMVRPKEKINWLIWVNLCAVVSLIVNLKFTGLLCAGVVAAVYYIYWLVIERKDFKIVFRNMTLAFLGVFSVAVLIVGANSYVQNLVEHHNPLYPIWGAEKVDIVTTMQPESFGDNNIVEKFIISMFSKTENVTYEKAPSLKMPGMIYEEEIEALGIEDVRIAGFGPLASVVFIISIILLLVFMVLLLRKERQSWPYVVLPLAAIGTSMLLTGEMWWARYIPQFYLIPVGVVIIGVYLSKYYNWRVMIPTIALVLVMVANLGCYVPAKIKTLKDMRAVDRDIQIMQVEDNIIVKQMRGTEDYGVLWMLKDNGINYTVNNNIENEEVIMKCNFRLGIQKEEAIGE